MLTKSEEEIMYLLWDLDEPLTSSEIVKKAVNKTWKKSCIYERMHSTKNGNYRRCPAGSRGVFAAARQCSDAVYL